MNLLRRKVLLLNMNSCFTQFSGDQAVAGTSQARLGDSEICPRRVKQTAKQQQGEEEVDSQTRRPPPAAVTRNRSS